MAQQDFAISTANLYESFQPGGSLWNLENVMPVNSTVAYASPVEDYGTEYDPALGKIHGGFIPFGGGFSTV